MPNTTLPNPDVEARLMAKYPPLISREEMVRRHDDNLPLLYGPGIVTDNKGHTLFWSLPEMLSASRQVSVSQLRKSCGGLTIFRRRSLRTHEFSKLS